MIGSHKIVALNQCTSMSSIKKKHHWLLKKKKWCMGSWNSQNLSMIDYNLAQ